MVQTIGRCHGPLLKNIKTFTFFGNMTKSITIYQKYYIIVSIFSELETKIYKKLILKFLNLKLH